MHPKLSGHLSWQSEDPNFLLKTPATNERLTVGGGTMEIQQLPGGQRVAVGADGKTVDIPATVPGDEKNTPLDSRAKIMVGRE